MCLAPAASPSGGRRRPPGLGPLPAHTCGAGGVLLRGRPAADPRTCPPGLPHRVLPRAARQLHPRGRAQTVARAARSPARPTSTADRPPVGPTGVHVVSGDTTPAGQPKEGRMARQRDPPQPSGALPTSRPRATRKPARSTSGQASAPNTPKLRPLGRSDIARRDAKVRPE